MGLDVTLELPYPQVSGNRAVRHGRFGAYRSKAAEDYHHQVARIVLQRGFAGLVGATPVQLEIVAWAPDRRARDSDNVEKVVRDALTRAKFWADDSNRVIRGSTFRWEPPAPDVPGGLLLVRVFSAG